MLGRGHLSILRQGRSSWPDRENFVNTPGTGREDMILIDGQLERDSLPEFCPKSLPPMYFSPPKRPWDFSKASQPKRLWDFSPPFCKGRLKVLAERLQVNTRSTRLLQDPREQCCRSLDTGGVCSTAAVGGINSNHLSSVHRCTPVRLAENADNAAQRPQNAVSKCHTVDEANMRRGFWQNEVVIPSSVEQQAVEAAAQNQESDHYLPSTFHHQLHSDFTQAAAPKEQISKASKLSAQVEFDIQEIERLKAQMALLCERLACHISRWSKDPCKTAVSDCLDSDESLLLKGLEELKRVIGVPNGSSESRREPAKDRGKDLEVENYTEGGETENIICSCRNLAWKRGISTLFQSILWCIGFVMTVVRCTQYSEPGLVPT